MSYHVIKPSGRDTAAPGSLSRRIAMMSKNLPDEKGFRFLDAGCGVGEYCEQFEKIFKADVAGVEYDSDKVNEAHSRGREYVTNGNLENLNYDDEVFEVVLLNEVLEHVENEKECIRELSRVLKSGGQVHVFSPNRLYPLETHMVYSRRSGKAIGKFFPMLPWLPSSIACYMVRFEARNYWPWTLRNLFREQGFKIRSENFLWQTFENISGESPPIVQGISPGLRKFASMCQKVPFLKIFGVSQYFVAIK